MNVAIFGGTFDPVHRGHLAVARAAQRACKLGRIYFVPADVPPHKQRQPITPFVHRYAMLTLALRGEERFVPSLVESPARPSKTSQGRATPVAGRRKPNYSIDTVRQFKKILAKNDRLFFILGIDMFETIASWHKPDELIRQVELIVVSRPGYNLPPPFDSAQGKLRTQRNAKASIQWLTEVAEDVSSSRIRKALASGRVIPGLLDEAVVEYIRKEHLYEGSRRKT